MGGAVSAGATNDELIDNLLEADYIETAIVEKVFRAVDRGHYFTVEYKEHAYRDIAWKYGNLHVSAPCIYSKVMETLKLGPGNSFLNLGSGTGYLSTMAGLILGPYGVNHGIEIHEDVITYAKKKLEEFKSSTSAVDEYAFCEPKFVRGNCLNFGIGARQYDRVYCSAACPENLVSYMKNLIKVGGILVIPVNDQLLQIRRISDTKWESKSVLPVSFAPLINGSPPDISDTLKMPNTDPLTLQDLCRFVVRAILKQNIDKEHPELQKRARVPKKRGKKKTKQLLMPIFHNNPDDNDDDFFRTLTEGSGRLQTSITNLPNIPNSTYVMTYLPRLEIEIEGDPPEQPEDPDQDLAGYIGDVENPPQISDDSDFEELYTFMGMSEVSDSNSETWEQEVTREAGTEQAEHESRNKEEKIDSGIVEDFEEQGFDSEEDLENRDFVVQDRYTFLKVTDVNTYSDTDSDTDSCLETQNDMVEGRKPTSPASMDHPREEMAVSTSTSSFPVNYPSHSQLPPNDLFTYTTYMKEKIMLLPLPMTLKYFLNLNREL